LNFIDASIFILLIAIVSVPLALKLRLPLEIFLVVGSCAISLMPGSPNFQINPVIVFNIFLPPILFYAAFTTSWRDFKVNISPISVLAVGLVLFTTVAVAALVKWMLPGFTWAEGFLLGAIVSPTDASAATTILKKLGAPRQFVSILEGESLVNDATALTLYRFSLAAILTDHFSPMDAVSQFSVIALGGIVVGLVIGYLAACLLKILRDVNAETALTMITAFSSYLVSEHLGFSGVISTVVTGLYFGQRIPHLLPSHTRVNARASWSTLMFIINGFVFALIGFQLPSVLQSLGSYSVVNLILYGVSVSFAVIILRVIWVYPGTYLPQLISEKIRKKESKRAWAFHFALGWTGMRGIISLAAVLAIPVPIISGVSFPHRDLLIFLTYCVVVATLVVPALTLPFVLRYLNLSEVTNKIKEEAEIRIKAIQEVGRRLKKLNKQGEIPERIYLEFDKQLNRRLKVISTQLEDQPYSVLTTDYFHFKKLNLAALDTERSVLLQFRETGEVHDGLLRKLLEELDIEEVRMRSLRV
jgi:Na+/H+ antiporter